MTKMYFQGETVRQKADITDLSGAYFDPDPIVISITDTKGIKKVDVQAMIKDATGKYHYDYLIPTDAALGLWIVEVKAISESTAIEQDQFTVVDSIE